jgi:hypothetical protein
VNAGSPVAGLVPEARTRNPFGEVLATPSSAVNDSMLVSAHVWVRSSPSLNSSASSTLEDASFITGQTIAVDGGVMRL